jgi:hypothetical protein
VTVKLETPSLRPLAASLVAVLAAFSSPAFAGDEDTPLSLTLSHDISRDSNFSRDASRQGETINTTGLRFALDKAYGRQTYALGARWTKSQYAHFGDTLNNDGKDLTATVTSGIASNWLVTLGGSYSQNLNPVQDNQGSSRIIRNIKTSRDGNLAVQYGNGGRWALVGTYDANKLTYSQDQYKFQNADQHSTGLRAIYYSSDVLNFGLGARSVSTHYPLNPSNETIRDKNIDLSANWQLTGLSNLNAYVSRRNSTASSNSSRHIKGWTGALDWAYSPQGLLRYGFNAARTTGSDRSTTTNNKFDSSTNGNGVSSATYNNVTTSYTLSSQLKATAKLNFGLSYGITQYKIDNSVGATSLDNSSRIYHSTRLTANYAAMRNVGLGCYLTAYSQTADQYRPKYDGRVYGCNANFTLD